MNVDIVINDKGEPEFEGCAKGKEYDYSKPIKTIKESLWEQDSEQEAQRERLAIRMEMLSGRRAEGLRKQAETIITVNPQE